MAKTPRKTIEMEIPCDTDRLYGDLKKAAAYLLEVHAAHPTAQLDENWLGYETMELRFIYHRPETDEEMGERHEAEAATERYREQERQKKAEREEKERQLRDLAKELGRTVR